MMNIFKRKKKEKSIDKSKLCTLINRDNYINVLIFCKDTEKFYSQFGNFVSSSNEKWNNFAGRILSTSSFVDGDILVTTVRREKMLLRCHFPKEDGLDVFSDRNIFIRVRSDILFVDKDLDMNEESLMSLLSYSQCSKKIHYF